MTDASPLPSGPPRPRRGKRRILWSLLILAVALLTKFILHLLLPRNFAGSGEKLPLELAGGPLEMPYYCGPDDPDGIVILGTGDGGWSYWEENTAKHLAEKGYAVGGWDCRKFADTRTYTRNDLYAGFAAAVAKVRERCGADEEVPVWYGGWSTGAEQSVAAATDPDKPAALRGLLLAAPGARGRYGLTTGDLLGKTPAGPDTFALADLAPQLKDLRVVQFAAGLDPMDDVEWIQRCTCPWKIIPLPGKLHDMGNAGADFQQKLDDGIAWTLQTSP